MSAKKDIDWLRKYYLKLNFFQRWFFPRRLGKELEQLPNEVEEISTDTAITIYKIFQDVGFLSRILFSGLKKFFALWRTSAFQAAHRRHLFNGDTLQNETFFDILFTYVEMDSELEVDRKSVVDPEVVVHMLHILKNEKFLDHKFAKNIIKAIFSLGSIDRRVIKMNFSRLYHNGLLDNDVAPLLITAVKKARNRSHPSAIVDGIIKLSPFIKTFNKCTVDIPDPELMLEEKTNLETTDKNLILLCSILKVLIKALNPDTTAKIIKEILDMESLQDSQDDSVKVNIDLLAKSEYYRRHDGKDLLDVVIMLKKIHMLTSTKGQTLFRSILSRDGGSGFLTSHLGELARDDLSPLSIKDKESCLESIIESKNPGSLVREIKKLSKEGLLKQPFAQKLIEATCHQIETTKKTCRFEIADAFIVAEKALHIDGIIEAIKMEDYPYNVAEFLAECHQQGLLTPELTPHLLTKLRVRVRNGLLLDSAEFLTTLKEANLLEAYLSPEELNGGEKNLNEIKLGSREVSNIMKVLCILRECTDLLNNDTVKDILAQLLTHKILRNEAIWELVAIAAKNGHSFTRSHFDKIVAMCNQPLLNEKNDQITTLICSLVEDLELSNYPKQGEVKFSRYYLPQDLQNKLFCPAPPLKISIFKPEQKVAADASTLDKAASNS